MCEKATIAADALPKSITPKQRGTGKKKIDNYLVEEMTSQREDAIETELKRLYYSTMDSVVGEMDQRFGERTSLDPKTDSFLDHKNMKHIIDLT